MKNKTKWFLVVFSLFIGVCLFMLNKTKETSMKLTHKKSGFVVAEIKDDKMIFHDPFLEKSMNAQGIFIPQAFRSRFHDKVIVYKQDPDFIKAFKEIYLPFSMDKSSYEWKD